MSEEAHLFITAEGEYLAGQALADAIKRHGVIRFNGLRAAHTSWIPDLRNADLTAPGAAQPKRGLEGKMLGDPSAWRPPTDSAWPQEARYANFSDANLQGANLSALDLSGANLSGARLAGALLGGAQLRRTDLSEADLHHADLRRADLFEANLAGANLGEASLEGASMVGAKVSADALSEATLDATTLLPDGLAYGAPESPWTVRIDAIREAAVKAVPEAAVAAEVMPAEAAPSFFARLWGKIKAWFGR